MSLWFRSIWDALIHMLSFCLSSHKISSLRAKCEWHHGSVTRAAVAEGTWEAHDSGQVTAPAFRRLMYWERELWSDRNLAENVLWREISTRESIPKEVELATSWENRVGGCRPVSPLSGKTLKDRESVLCLSLPLSAKAEMPYPKQGVTMH